MSGTSIQILFLDYDPGRLWSVMVDAAIKSMVVLVAAGIATGLLRRATAALRHLIWSVALVVALAMPGLSAILPGWRVLPAWIAPAATVSPRMLPVQMTTVEDRAAVARMDANENLPAKTTGPVEANPIPLKAMERAPWSWDKWIVLGWVVGAVLMLLPIGMGILSVWRLGWKAERIEDSQWNALLSKCVERLGLRRRVTLLWDERRTMPMTWGIARPRVLLPREARDWDAGRREFVLLHELGHVKRWDCLTQIIAQVARAVYWFNPLAWVAVARILVERERACDDLVLTLGAKASDYAEELLSVATGCRMDRLFGAAGVAMARSSRLEGRVRAILDQTRNRRRLTIAGGLVIALLLAGAFLPIAALRSAAKADNSSPTTDASADGKTVIPSQDTPWQATLSDGISVELIGVSENPSAGKAWWKPDGSPLRMAPYESLSASVTPQEGQLAREFAVRLTKLPKDSVDVRFDCGGSSAGGGPPDFGQDPRICATAAVVKDGQPATVRVGIAAGNWRTIAENTDPKDLLAVGPEEGGVIFAPVAEQNGDLTATVATDMTDGNLRVTAVEKDGTERVSGMSTAGSAGKVLQIHITFTKLALKDVRAIRLEQRDYQWAEFRNVATQPTAVQSSWAAFGAVAGTDWKRFYVKRLGISVALPPNWVDDTASFDPGLPHVGFREDKSPWVDQPLRVTFGLKMQEMGQKTSLDLASKPGPTATISEIMRIDGVLARLTGYPLPIARDWPTGEWLMLQIARGSKIYEGDFMLPAHHRDFYLEIAKKIFKSIKFE